MNGSNLGEQAIIRDKGHPGVSAFKRTKRFQKPILLTVVISVLSIGSFCTDNLPAADPEIEYHHPPSSSFTAPEFKSYRTFFPMIGFPGEHIVKKRATLLDVARDHDLGFNEMHDLYPRLDPWLLQEKTVLTIPTQWILPARDFRGIVINVAELRLYFYFNHKDPRVVTFPVGIGDLDWPTPTGKFMVQEKRAHPTWFIPPSLKEKYKVKSIPPGPDNPLGQYWIGIGKDYGIHGTDIPWSVGRLVTRGCIRLYPEDMEQLFKHVHIGVRVNIIYEPVKIALVGERCYAEVHKDVYGRIEDLVGYGFRLLMTERFAHKVDSRAFYKALVEQNGLPVDVTRVE